jgi:hypothetical protein
MERSEIRGGIDASRQSRITLRSIRATALEIADPLRQRKSMAESGPVTTFRIAACESLSVKTRRDEPPLGVDVI